jgi:hypothetical protein
MLTLLYGRLLNIEILLHTSHFEALFILLHALDRGKQLPYQQLYVSGKRNFNLHIYKLVPLMKVKSGEAGVKKLKQEQHYREDGGNTSFQTVETYLPG